MVPSGNLINIETPTDQVHFTSRPPIDNQGLAQVQLGEMDESTIFDLNLAAKNDDAPFPEAARPSNAPMRLERPEPRRSSPSRFRIDKANHNDLEFLMNEHKTIKRDDDVKPHHDEGVALREEEQPREGHRRSRSRSRGRSHSPSPTHGGGQAAMDDYYSHGQQQHAFEDTNDFRRTILGGVSSIKSEVPDPMLPTENAMSDEQCNQLKLQYLSEYRRKNPNYEYSPKELSMDDSLGTIKRELDFVRREKSKEGGKRIVKKGLGIAAQGLVYLNNQYQPFGVTMDHWRNQFDQELNVHNDYDEMIEEIVQNYGDRLSLPVEIKLAIALSTSFGCGMIAAREEKRMMQEILQKEQARKEEIAQKEMMEAAASIGVHQQQQQHGRSFHNNKGGNVSISNNPLNMLFNRQNTRVASPPAPIIQLSGPSRSADEMRQLLQDQFMEDSDYQASEMGEHDNDTSVNLASEDRAADQSQDNNNSEAKRKPGRPKGSRTKRHHQQQSGVEINVPMNLGA